MTYFLKEDYEIYDSLPCSAVVFSVDDDYKIYYTNDKNRVLLVDMDPQANATQGIGIDRDNIELSTYNIIVEE